MFSVHADNDERRSFFEKAPTKDKSMYLSGNTVTQKVPITLE